MPVKVKCTQCGKVLSAPDAARGKAIKCPQCQTRLAVPEEDDDSTSDSSKSSSKSKSSTSKSTKTKSKRSSRQLDSEESLLAFDMSRAEDREARICSKCGFDMKYQDEEDNECPQCGFDSTVGGMGTKARKKSMKGPDPADFYPGLIKDAVRFIGRNQLLAWRTVLYTVICLLLSEMFAFCYLWISMWPTRVFLAFCFLVSFLVIPGWMWLLDTEVIKLTLERKEKFKRLNFDFFLSSAMGIAFVAWSVVVGVPLLAIPAIFILPVTMTHMSMPVKYRAWQFWEMARLGVKNFKPLCYCFLWLFLTNIPNIGGATAIGVIYGQSLVKIVNDMNENAVIYRARFAIQENPNAKLKKKGADPNAGKSEAEKQREKLEELAKREELPVDYKVFIVPSIILALMCVVNGFTSMINMRIHGQFAYYNKGTLDLVDRVKEYKYVAKERTDDDDDDMKPKTVAKAIVEAVTLMALFDLMGLVGGMLWGSLTDAGIVRGILVGMMIGQTFGALSTFFSNVALAFRDSAVWGLLTFFFYPIGFIVFVTKNWEERKGPFFQMLFMQIGYYILTIVCVVGGLLLSASEMPPAPAGPPNVQGMQGGPPAGMPGQGGPTGMPQNSTQQPQGTNP